MTWLIYGMARINDSLICLKSITNGGSGINFNYYHKVYSCRSCNIVGTLILNSYLSKMISNDQPVEFKD